jgi:hypothetical protein
MDVVRALVDHFWDPTLGGFFQAASDAEVIGPERRKTFADGVLPSANSIALLVLSKLAHITADTEYEAKAEAIVRRYPADLTSFPIQYSFLLSALDVALGPTFEVVISGDPSAPDTRAMVRAAQSTFAPNKVLILRPSDTRRPAIVANRALHGGAGSGEREGHRLCVPRPRV